jgi:hypothetical protein
LALDVRVVSGAATAMKCLACGAEMGLMQVEQRGDPTLEVAFERHTFKCLEVVLFPETGG